MLFLKEAGLVYLANPKTATQSIRKMLHPYSDETPLQVKRAHINAPIYLKTWQPRLAAQHGFAPQTCAVMRDPLAHRFSWYRYRQRPDLIGHENSTAEISFADFIEAHLRPIQPSFANTGRQDRFMGYRADTAPPGPSVNYIFDYERLDIFLAFINDRLKPSEALTLPRVNISQVTTEKESGFLPPELLSRFQQLYAAEFSLYQQVKAQGVLVTPGLIMG